MYARLTISRISPERIDEFKKRYEETVLPTTRSLKGYKGICALADRKTGNGVFITFWESEEDAAKATRLFSRIIRETCVIIQVLSGKGAGPLIKEAK